jgi:Flp pilus assembly pilin Flp
MRDGHINPAVSSAKPRGGLIHRLLFAHPRTVGETYVEHARIAGRFGATMVVGGVKCLVHAVLPAVFERAASDCVARLNGELTRRRAAAPDANPDYVI